jgi:hypothetical protein
MKKCFFFLLVSLYLVQPVVAQNKFGIKAGPNFSIQKKEWLPAFGRLATLKTETHFLVGYQLGAYYTIALIKNWSFATEASLSMIGAKGQVFSTTQDGRTDEADFNDKVGYIDLPVLLQHKFKKLQIAAGPSIAYKVYSKSTENPRLFLGSGNTSYNDMDFGLNAALGYTLYKKFSIGARYYYGLVDVEATEVWRIKNRYFNISARYALK